MPSICCVVSRLNASLPNGRDHRQPERQERGKRGASIDPSGYDAGKTIKGKKRHLLVDTQGLLVQALVHPADIQDRTRSMGDDDVVGSLSISADTVCGRRIPGAVFRDGLERVCRSVTAEIIKPRIGPSGSRFCPSAGSWSGRSGGSIAAGDWPRTGNVAPQGAGFPAPGLHPIMLRNSVRNQYDLGQTLRL